jgi:hypothetical protein
MKDTNLVLKYRLVGEEQFQIRGANRIKIDGHGGLMFYETQNDAINRIELSQLQSFSLLSLRTSSSISACSLRT